MSLTIQHKRSNTAGATPGTLADGEIAIQQADGILFWRTAAAAIVQLLLPKRKAISDAAYQILATDTYVGITSLTASRTLTLPTAASYPAGHALTVADESGSCSNSITLTIAASGSDTISGQSSAIIGDAYHKLTFHSNGSNLWTFA